MIIKKFEEQVKRFSQNIAVKIKDQSITYCQLNHYANRVANEINIIDQARGTKKTNIVALLFEHDFHMIAGIIGALKANKAYVPLDVTYPSRRLVYMLEHSDSYLVLTTSEHVSLAQDLVRQSPGEIRILSIDDMKKDHSSDNTKREASGDRPAYILYTSGSTGRPKGAVQNHENVLYFIRHYSQRFSITESDRILLLASLSHDGAIPDIFGALLNGAVLYPFDIKKRTDIDELKELLLNEKITIWHSVPTFYRYFAGGLTIGETYPDLRWIVLGGEEVREDDLLLFQSFFPGSTFASIYGQTESTINSIWVFHPTDSFKRVIIGEPIGETEIFLVDDQGDIVEEMDMGEIIIASQHVALEYWHDKEATTMAFTTDDQVGRLYWTGDLGRLHNDGNITFIGRKDDQVKIRGFRVETGEIETILLQHHQVKETVVIAKENENGDHYLAAYIVLDQMLSPKELRSFLSLELPDYMIPRYFIPLEQMPLTPNGKVDRQLLPEPEESSILKTQYEPPTNETERKMVAVWQEVLEIDTVGINDNFVELGGHSLLVISLIAKIHQVFDVELELNDVFENPTIKELSTVVTASEEHIFSSIQPAEEKEYYPVTFNQMRMFALNQFEDIGTTYNLPVFLQIEGEPARQHLENVFGKLIKRHEAFRTAFKVMKNQIFQVIRQEVEFSIQYVDQEEKHPLGGDKIRELVNQFIQPFDLSQAPLVRVSLAKLPENKHLLLVDTHHIISDGMSAGILLEEFSCIYAGEEPAPLKIRYRDYSQWQHQLFVSQRLKPQESYWLSVLNKKIPVLNLPYNYPRPPVQSFEGDIVAFYLERGTTLRLKHLVAETGTTLFILLLAMYNVLLHKYTGQEDIVVGTIIAGRNHVDLERVVGFFVRTLPLRNNLTANKSFEDFLQEVKDTTLKGFDNQQYPFSKMIEALNLTQDQTRNPLFDAALILQSNRLLPGDKNRKNIDLKSTLVTFDNTTSMFDLSLEVVEMDDDIGCVFQYRTRLFQRETIELMKERFLVLIESILNDKRKKIKDLDYMIPVEKEIKSVEEVEINF